MNWIKGLVSERVCLQKWTHFYPFIHFRVFEPFACFVSKLPWPVWLSSFSSYTETVGGKVESVESYTFSIKIRRRCAAGCGMVLMYASCLLDTLYHSLWSRDSHIWSSYSSFSTYSTKPADGLGWMVCFVLPLAQPLQYFYSHFRHLWEYKSLDYLYVCVLVYFTAYSVTGQQQLT